MMMDARGRTKRARAEDAGGANDAGFEDAAVDDDDADDAAVDALGATRASNARGDEAAEGERARGDAAARSVDGTPGTRNAPSKTRDMRAHFRKAKPLGEEDVATLDEAGRRRALARWNARLRVLKKKIRDASAQYPTSSLVLVFTKPFRSRARSDRWAEEEFMALGPITRAEDELEEDGEMLKLSGTQSLKRRVSKMLGFHMNPQQLKRGALAAAPSDDELAQDSLESLFEAMKHAVPPSYLGYVANVLASSSAVLKTRTAGDRRVEELAERFRREQAADHRPRTIEEALAVVRELHHTTRGGGGDEQGVE